MKKLSQKDDDRLRCFIDGFKTLMEKWGYSHFIAVDIESGEEFHHVIFGATPNDRTALAIAFEKANTCACCAKKKQGE